MKKGYIEYDFSYMTFRKVQNSTISKKKKNQQNDGSKDCKGFKGRLRRER